MKTTTNQPMYTLSCLHDCIGKKISMVKIDIFIWHKCDKVDVVRYNNLCRLCLDGGQSDQFTDLNKHHENEIFSQFEKINNDDNSFYVIGDSIN